MAKENLQVVAYRNANGQFMSAYDYERTYGDLRQGESISLNDPETRAIIRDISGEPRPRRRYEPIHNVLYLVWIAGSAFAIFTAFFLGAIVYR